MTSSLPLRQAPLVQIILIFILAIVDITPQLSRTLPPSVSFSIFIIWVVLAVMSTGYNSVFRDKNKVAFWWSILICWQLFLSFIGFSTRTPGFFIHRISIYLMPIIGIYCIRFFNKKELNLLFNLLLVVLLYNLIDNVILGSGKNNYFENYGYNEDAFLSSNAGKSAFVNTMMYLSGLMVLLYISSKKQLIKITSLTIAMLSFVYVTFINSRTTATILLLFMVVGLIYFDRQKKEFGSHKLVGFFIVVVLLVFLMIPFFDSILALLPNRSAERLSSIPDALRGNLSISDYNQDDSLGLRIVLSKVSLTTWLSGPLTFFFGKGEDVATDGSIIDLVNLGIGQHSQIIDFLAMYGLFGLFLLYKALRASYFSILKLCDNQKMGLKVKMILFIFLLASVLNNSLFPGEMFLLAIMLPILIVLLKKTDVYINKKGYVSKTL